MPPALGSVKEASEAVENEEVEGVGFEGDLLAVVEERAVRWGEVGIVLMGSVRVRVRVRVVEGGDQNRRVLWCFGFGVIKLASETVVADLAVRRDDLKARMIDEKCLFGAWAIAAGGNGYGNHRRVK